jgi:hypothetical protein
MAVRMHGVERGYHVYLSEYLALLTGDVQRSVSSRRTAMTTNDVRPLSLSRAAQELLLTLTAVRRDLHHHPEPGWLAYRTTGLVARRLRTLEQALDPLLPENGSAR